MKDQKTFSCKHCSHHSSNNITNLKIHKTIKHNECHECGETCVSKSLLMKHQESLHPDYKGSMKVKKCSKCDYTSISNLVKGHFRHVHEKAKAKSRGVSCDKCDFASYRLSQLEIHQRNTRNTTKVLICGVCQFRSCTRNGLAKHENIMHKQTQNEERSKHNETQQQELKNLQSQEMPKMYNYFPQPKRGEWTVKLERISWK